MAALGRQSGDIEKGKCAGGFGLVGKKKKSKVLLWSD